MKKIIFLLLIVLFYAGSSAVYAQTSDKAILMSSNSIGADAAAVRATRDLYERIGDHKAESWYKLPGGYLAVYTEGVVDNRYIYDKRGNWVYSMLTYQEEQLPAEVRKEVKGNYYDFSIGWAKEVRQGTDIIYIVHVENKTGWKDLSVKDGEIGVLQQICK